ncbi:hypothetical protein M3J09_007272 [Ascochyta lentis]
MQVRMRQQVGCNAGSLVSSHRLTLLHPATARLFFRKR